MAAEELQPAPTETLYATSNGTLRNQFHDVSKYVTCNGEIKIQYTLENETKAKRKTVLRKAGYEGAVYREQYDKKNTHPIISCVLYWGKGYWKAPKSLYQLWNVNEISEQAKKYITDIKLHVFNMRSLSKEVRSRFRSDMRIVVDYLAEGKKYIPSNQKIIHVEALVRMLKELTGDERYAMIPTETLVKQEGRGGLTMCELLDKYIAIGIEQGIEKGIERGEHLLSDAIRNLMETTKWTVEQAMDALKIPNEDREKYLKLI